MLTTQQRLPSGRVYKLFNVRKITIYFVSSRGTSTTNKQTAFRAVYSELHELRTLAPSVRMIALTATATEDTKATILDVLRMREVLEIRDSPNKKNIKYCGVFAK